MRVPLTGHDFTDSVQRVSDRPTATPAGWFPDPLGRYDHRWFNGSAWTADVSVDGGRFVDPSPFSGPVSPADPTATAPTRPSTPGGTPFGTPIGGVPQPSRTLAVLALIAGLVSIATGWMPILFVVGALAGIAAIVIGTSARRRATQGRAGGRRMALAGLILGPIGLASCVVGVLLTGVVLREVREYTEPGPTDVEVTSCVVEGRAVRVSGTIENLDDMVRDYSIVIEVIDGRDVVDRDDVPVVDVSPGELRSWKRLILTRGNTPAEAECEVFSVMGPFPFGLDPNP